MRQNAEAAGKMTAASHVAGVQAQVADSSTGAQLIGGSRRERSS